LWRGEKPSSSKPTTRQKIWREIEREKWRHSSPLNTCCTHTKSKRAKGNWAFPKPGRGLARPFC
jgi:hypothetical protein